MHRVQVNEYTALLRIRVFYTGEAYTLNIESGNNVKAPRQYVFRGDHDSFVRFLMGIKAKDNKTYPRSVRGERYSDIADEIENGTDQIIYVWEHDFMRYINKKKTESTKSLSEKRISFSDIYSAILAESRKSPKEYKKANILKDRIQIPLLYQKNIDLFIRGGALNDILLVGSPDVDMDISINDLSDFDVFGGDIIFYIQGTKMHFIIG